METTTEYSVVTFYGTSMLSAPVDAQQDTIEAARRLVQRLTNVLYPPEQFVQIGTYTTENKQARPPKTLVLTGVSHLNAADAARVYLSVHFDSEHSAWKRL
jgi:hypothetical protein